MTKIFISYRRDDSSYIAGMINERLEKHFGPNSVFLDIDSIPLGLDFRKQISDSVGQCNVLLALIGDSWMNSTNDQGSRRLDDPTDFVRLEVESALKRDIPVIPVLVGKARMPSATELPSSLQELAFRNAAEVRAGLDLQEHLTRLVRGIDLLSKNNPTILESQQNDNDEFIGKPATSKASTASAPASGENEMQHARWTMNHSQEEITSIDELKQFTKFLQSLWGTLAGISVLFPLSNALTKVIPLAQWPEGGFVYFNPTLVTAISTVTCLFIIIWTFGRRLQFANAKRRRLIRRESAVSFVVGGIGLSVYLIGHYAVVQNFYYTVFNWVTGDPQRVFGDLLVLIAYCVFFAFMTRACMLLGMLEYYGSERRAA
jgi:hypothetical protein